MLDRNGKLLRAYATTDGRWRLPAKVSDVDPRFFDVLFAYEDKRFRSHHGVDPLAVMRATMQFVTSGRLRSGASTLTMQVARLVEGRHPRDLPGKLEQMVRAVEMERVLTKDQVLALYLDLAPYGGNIEGIRAASLVYLGKEPKHLTLAEAALLVALPQSPEPRRPDRAPDIARAARDRVLDRFAATGKVPADEIALAKSEPVPNARHPMPMLAPHAADQAMMQDPAASVFHLTIDAGMQNSLEQLARERERTLVTTLGPNVSLAILAVDNATGQVLAHVGSPAYFDAGRAGQVDMAQAVRSPGSTLKPFIYGLGFEDGFIHPETLIEDRPVSYGAYAPKDFDYGFKGTVSVREALQFSLNVPAVAVLDRVGPVRLAARLTQAGAALTLPNGQAPGLALGLGGVGIRLADLVKLYAGIARLGLAVPLSERMDADAPEARRLMEPAAAWYVSNVLLGSPPPENGVAGRIAFKTGTSYGYRDAWSVGFDGKHTIGVWVGRPDGAPVPGLIGREGRGPDPVRRFRSHRRFDHCFAACTGRCGVRFQCQAAAAAAAFSAGTIGRRYGPAAAPHHVSAGRRAPRSDADRRQARSGCAESHRRGRAFDRARQRRADAGRGQRRRLKCAVLQSGGARLLADHRDRCLGRCRQYRRAGGRQHPDCARGHYAGRGERPLARAAKLPRQRHFHYCRRRVSVNPSETA